MTYDIHISGVGETADTTFNVLMENIPMKKLYLLNNDNEKFISTEKEIVDKLNSIGFENIVVERIDPFDYQDIYNTVLKISKEEMESHPDACFHLNITRGTNIMAGAMCSASYLMNSDIYYVKAAVYSKTNKEEWITIDVESFPELEMLKTKESYSVFLKFKNKEEIDNAVLKTEFKSLTYKTKELSGYGLIEKIGTKNCVWRLTNKGKMVLKRI